MNRFEILLKKEYSLWDRELKRFSSTQDFKQEYLGEFVEPTCSVSDGHDNYCPSKSEHFFEHNGKEIGLCKSCYIHYLSNHFSRKFQIKNYGSIIYCLI